MSRFFSPDYLLYLGDKVIKIVAILAIVSIVLKVSGTLIDRFFNHEIGMQKYIEEKRARTLSALLKLVVRYTLYFVAAVAILQEFHIDTTSILAGAGVVGLAVGVGAQGLVKDVVTGFFVILEDQYAVGDYIASGEMAGIVEEISFRVTKLRDGKGVLHIIPNGGIARVSNFTRGHMMAVINLPVAYEADIDLVIQILRDLCRELRPSMPEIAGDPEVVGVVDIQPGIVIIRVVAKTIALAQEKVETEFRRRAKLAFDAAGVPAPYWVTKPGQTGAAK